MGAPQERRAEAEGLRLHQEGLSGLPWQMDSSAYCGLSSIKAVEVDLWLKHLERAPGT